MNPAPRTLHRIELALTLRAPWLVHGNDPGSHGLDAVQLRGPYGRRVLPGTLLAGRIRAAWRELGTRFGLQDVPQDLAWFGPLAEADKADDGIATPAGAGKHRRQPLRARVHVSDLLEGALPQGAGHIATRVEINEASGAASDGMLLALEQLDLPGKEVTVYGLWHAWLALGEAEPLARHIAKALRWQTQLGAQRSVGFGELVDVKVQLLANASDNGSAAQLDAFVGGDKGEVWTRTTLVSQTEVFGWFPKWLVNHFASGVLCDYFRKMESHCQHLMTRGAPAQQLKDSFGL